MAEYELHDDDGNVYTVEAETEEAAAKMLSNHLSSNKTVVQPTSQPTEVSPEKPEPGLIPSLGTGARILGQGIPIAGRYISDTDESAEYKRAHPTATKVMQTGSSIASAIPVAMAATAAAPVAYPTLGAMYLNAIGQGGISAIDSYLGGKSGEDVAKDATLSAVLGAAGPAIGKFISRAPSARELAYKDTLAKRAAQEAENAVLVPKTAAERVASASEGRLGTAQNTFKDKDMMTGIIGNPANSNRIPLNTTPAASTPVTPTSKESVLDAVGGTIKAGVNYGIPLEVLHSFLSGGPIGVKGIAAAMAAERAANLYKKAVPHMQSNNVFAPLSPGGQVLPTVLGGVAGATNRDQLPFIYGSGNAE